MREVRTQNGKLVGTVEKRTNTLHIMDKWDACGEEIDFEEYEGRDCYCGLEELGAEHGFTIFPFGQGFISMSPTSKDFYQFVMEGKIRHGKHPVLDWNMSNVIVDQDAAGNIKPNKKKSTEKIDGVVAMIMGLARATLGGGVNDSVYDERGLLIL